MDRAAWKALPRAERQSKKAQMRREMLAAPTRAEARLLEIAREAAPRERWRPQVMVCGYIADVACKALRIVLEADGESHYTHEGEIHDAKRDSVMRRKGWEVLRWPNATIETEGDFVRRSVVDLVAKRVQASADFTLREQYAIRMFARMKPEKRERAIAAIRDAAKEKP